VTASLVQLDSGAEGRVRNTNGELAAVLVNGGSADPVPGTWSATSELIATELAPCFLSVRFLEVRYRVKTWAALEWCVDDAAAAVDHVAAGAGTVLLIGFSMGGAVAIRAASDPAVAGVLGLAPWIPRQLQLDGLRDKRFDVVHGGWDRSLPGIPGVSAASSRAGFQRALDRGCHGTYTLLPRGLHGAALRRRSGRLVRLPGWKAWLDHTATALRRFEAGSAG
jgi:pimeloyl-ACP methyl ester carboxylesterase